MAEEISIKVATEYDIVCHEGDDFVLTMDVKNPDETDFNFSGYTAKMQVRKRRVESDPAILTFETGGAGITLTTGQMSIEKAAANMAGISGDYFYDLKITDSGSRIATWLYGKFKIFPTVTT